MMGKVKQVSLMITLWYVLDINYFTINKILLLYSALEHFETDHFILVQKEGEKPTKDIVDDNRWEINFPFSLSDEEVEILGKNLPILGKNFRVRGGKLSFNDYLPNGYDGTQYYNVKATELFFDLQFFQM